MRRLFAAACETLINRPLPLLLRWAERRFGYELPDGLSLWHYRAVVGYAAEAAVPAFALFVLLHVLAMPDYADAAACAQWERLYVTHWWTRSVSGYIFVVKHVHGVSDSGGMMIQL